MAVDVEALKQMVIDRAVELADRLGQALVEEIQQNAPFRSGELSRSTDKTDADVSGDTVSVTVFVDAEYGRYQDEGTGIYGPEGQPIFAQHRKRNGAPGVLVFDWPAAGGIVFFTHVAGTEPTRFFTKAVEAWPQLVSRVAAGG